MTNPYRDLFSMPGVRGFVVTGFIGRMSMSMLGIGVVLLISAITGSYGTAGAVSATLALAYAAGTPMSGRLVDRFGQSRILLPAVACHAAGMIGLMVCAELRAPNWTLFATAILAGATAPSLGSMVRARWSDLLGASPRLHTAFSFESVADEVIFVTGPVLVTLLATGVHPLAGLTLALALTVSGTVAFALLRRTEPAVKPHTGRVGTPVTIPGVLVLLAACVAMGSVFGAVDIITIAFAQAEGFKPAAGGLLASFAFGSMVSGLWYGSRHWRLALHQRFVRTIAVFAAGLVPLVFVGNLGVMAVALFLAGLGIAPSLINSFALIQRLVPPRQLTEGMAWLSTSIGSGVAAGAWAGGRLADTVGPHQAYGFPLIAGIVAAAIGIAGSGWLRTDAPPEPKAVPDVT